MVVLTRPDVLDLARLIAHHDLADEEIEAIIAENNQSFRTHYESEDSPTIRMRDARGLLGELVTHMLIDMYGGELIEPFDAKYGGGEDCRGNPIEMRYGSSGRSMEFWVRGRQKTDVDGLYFFNGWPLQIEVQTGNARRIRPGKMTRRANLVKRWLRGQDPALLEVRLNGSDYHGRRAAHWHVACNPCGERLTAYAKMIVNDLPLALPYLRSA